MPLSPQIRELAARLRGVELFRGCTDVELEGIAQLATELDVPAGEQVLARGTVGSDAFVILEGKAEVSIGDRVLGVVGAGEVIGEMGALNPSLTRSASIVATSPLRLLAFEGGAFVELLNIPTIDRRVLGSLVERLRSADAALTD